MFLSKIWFILVALFAGFALSIALTAPRPMVQKLEELEGQRLDRAQYATEQMMKVDAHKWIDHVARLGRDAVLAESLDSASKGSGELSVQHRTVQGRVRALLPDLAGAGIATIVALDASGRVVARVGQDEANFGENIAGAELVDDALRGFLSDDVWGIGGHLLRVAAAPILSKSRDRIVGALYVGAETGEGFAERLKKNLDVDVALLLRGKVVASTLPAEILGQLGEMVDQHKTEIETMKRSSALPIEVGTETYLAVAAAFPGQASQQQAYYVLIGKKPARADVKSLLANTSARDLRWSNFPWIGLLGTILGVVAIGLFLQRLEVDQPIAKMRAELRALIRVDGAKLDDHKFGGGFGGIARDVNAALEHVAHAHGHDGHGPSSLGDAPPPGSAFGGESHFDQAARAVSGPPLIPGLGGPPPTPAAAPPAFSPPPPSFPPPSFAPPPPPSFAAPATAAVEDEDSHVRDVYQQFLAMKEQCGEPTAGLTLEKFSARLRDNR
ncbi:MAG TPA: MXAN_5187 C-terminal domain-containing protein, partial [Polyangia bacterium]|nr:MXAN_5187 C-terminal domain-containing protein [Polyangia bacterium]